MLPKYKVAGTEVAFTLEFKVDGEYVVPDDASVRFSVRNHDGSLIGALADVAVVTTAADTHKVVSLPAIYNGKVREVERRTVDYQFAVGGNPYYRRSSYYLIDYLDFDVIEEDVRNVLGAARRELPDEAIDVVAAYFAVKAEVAPAVLSDLLLDTPIRSREAHDAILHTAALQCLPSFKMRAEQETQAGSDKSSRTKVDWRALERDLRAELFAALAALKGATGAVPTLLTVTSRADPLLGG